MNVGTRVRLVGVNPYHFDSEPSDTNNHFYSPGNLGTIVETGGGYCKWYAIKIDKCPSEAFAYLKQEFEVVE